MRWLCFLGWHCWRWTHKAVWHNQFSTLAQEFRTCTRCGNKHSFDQELIEDAVRITRQLPLIEET